MLRTKKHLEDLLFWTF